MGRVPRLVGTDGNAKMSKSRGNTIDLKDSAETVARKVRGMYAGPPRGAKEPGMVAENPVFLYLDAFDHDAAQVSDLKERYERTGVSNKELKDRLTTVLNELLEPMRERRAKYEANMSLVREALEHGTKRARAIAQGDDGDGARRARPQLPFRALMGRQVCGALRDRAGPLRAQEARQSPRDVRTGGAGKPGHRSPRYRV